VNVLGVDEVEPNGLLKAADDEAVELLLNILVLATVKDEAAEELGDENANPLPDPEKAAPVPNAELPNIGPEEEVVTPKDTVPRADEEGAAAPKDTVPGPDEEAPAPNEKRPGPAEEAPAPIETLPGPDEEAPTPKDTVLGPDEDAPAPNNKVPEPEDPAPKETVPGPGEEAAAPVATVGNEELNCMAGLCDTVP